MISLRQKLGQMLLMGFDGTEVNDHHPVVHWLRDCHLGGVILFDYDMPRGEYGKNIVESIQVRQLLQKLDKYSASVYPLFKAIDYEGGAVDRLSKLEDCMTTLSPAKQALLDPKQFQEEIALMADTLVDLGFNLNFAPVVDLNICQQEGIIGKLARSFGDDADFVSARAQQFVEIFARNGLATCYKHFPGHGSALGDTHEGFVDVTDSFIPAELQPYKELVDLSVYPVMVMTAHVINRQLDDSGLPATLSEKILTGLLRQEMAYGGVIISDDLQMRAIADHYSLSEALQLTINAGADMVIIGNQLGQANAYEVMSLLEELVQAEKIPMQRIDEAYGRVIRMKKLL